MRRIAILLVLALGPSSAWAATASSSVGRDGGGESVAGAPWIKRAPAGSLESEAATAAAQVEAIANRPIVLAETNYYTFLPGEPVQLRITIHPNGYGSPTTLYLYTENRTTGERRYYNVPARALLPAGTSADLFGAAGSPIAVTLPTLSDFVLFASTTDAAALSFGVAGALGGSMAAPAGQPGLHQWVLEVRDPAGKRVISKSNAMFSYISGSVPVNGAVLTSTTWTANNRYVLSGFVGVADGVTLTIEPGTVIYGGDSRAALFVRRGARIMADGTARRPIIFTSPQKVGARAQRDWGSLVVLGRAPINEPGGQGFLEGLPSAPEYAFGGTNPADSSGVLRYIRLEFGGFEIEANQEINGLTLAGVGNGTTIEFVEVLHNKDDGVEFFGGTVNVRYALIVATADDPIDWDLGYTGNVQFVAAIKRGVNDENDGNVAIEGDGHPQNFTLTPLTNPRIYNVTGYGTGRTDLGAYGAVLRRGSAGKMYNMIISGTRRPPVTMRDDATFANAASGQLVLDSSILSGDFADAAFANTADRASQTRNFIFGTMTRNRNLDPQLAAGAPSLIKTLMPDLTPLPESPALDANFVANPPDNGFLQPVDFIGAVGPGNNWVLSGWANFSDN